MFSADQPRRIAVRLISRHSSETALSALAVIERFLPRGGDAAIIAMAILRTCLRDWIWDQGPRRPDRLTIIASINGTATSLGHPYPTVHRLVGKLRALGLVVPSGDGVAISHDDRWALMVLRFLEDASDVLLRFVEEVRDADQINLSLYMPARRPPALAIRATALDMFLMPAEMFCGRNGDWTSMKIWGAITSLTVRHVTIDPVLSASCTYRSTPDSERRPVASADLRRVKALSSVTAWRHGWHCAPTYLPNGETASSVPLAPSSNGWARARS